MLKHEFAAILLDVRLPGMDGYEVAAAIRSAGAHAPHADHLHERARTTAARPARDGSAEIYLRKPLEPDILRPTLAQLLSSKEP